MNEKEREELILSQLEEVEKLARMVYSRLGTLSRRLLTFDEVMSAGYVGLCQAADRYDPDIGVKFRTYLGHRVVGEMLDETRKAQAHYRKFVNAGLIEAPGNGVHIDGDGTDSEGHLYLRRARSQIAGSLLSQHIAHLITRLPEMEQRIANCLVRGDSVLDICEAVGLSRERVNWFLNFKIRRFLQRELAKSATDFLELLSEETCPMTVPKPTQEADEEDEQ